MTNISKIQQNLWDILAKAMEDSFKEGYDEGFIIACDYVLDLLKNNSAINLKERLKEIIEEGTPPRL